ncbi:hypothetical protein FRC05_007226, partial [Tulasnella sp. 425]
LVGEDSEIEHKGLEGKRLTKLKSTTLTQLANDHNIPGLENALADYLQSLNPAIAEWPEEFQQVD